MRLTEFEELACPEDRFPDMVVLRKMKDCTIWLAGHDELLLVLVDDANRRTAVFAYDSAEERERDATLVRKLPDDGSFGAGVFAQLPHNPPPRVTGFEEPFPPN